MPLPSKNIETGGRIIRALSAAALFAAAAFTWQFSGWAAVILAVCAGFVAFEAVRGWCVLRACGFKTPF